MIPPQVREKPPSWSSFLSLWPASLRWATRQAPKEGPLVSRLGAGRGGGESRSGPLLALSPVLQVLTLCQPSSEPASGCLASLSLCPPFL